MQLSIIATLFYSSSTIYELHKRISCAAQNLVGKDYEIIFVNDGSPDDSLEIVVQISKLDNHVRVIDLSRNFGHHKAIMTGLSYSKGEKVFLIDSDLEEDPEWMTLFYEKMSHSNCDMVYGVQKKRKGSKLEQLTGYLYYKILHLFIGINIPQNIVTARLMTRRFTDGLLQFSETEFFLGGITILAGFKQIPVYIKKNSTSPTTYTILKKINLLITSITSFSNTPLIIIFYIGIFILIVSIINITFLFFNWILFAHPPSGYTSVVSSIWLLGGLTISLLGVIGIYLSKIFLEIKRRPITIVKAIYGFK